MKYAIYGVNRVARDFIYIFDEIEIVCFYEEVGGSQFCGKTVYSIGELKKHDTGWDKIIVCDFEKEHKNAVLEQMGLRYGEDFIYEEDMFQKLDEIQLNPRKKRLAVWGTGRWAERFSEWNCRYTIDFYIDTYKKQETLYDIPVIKPSEILDWKDIFIIIAVAKSEEIEEGLKNEGLEEYIDFCSSQKMMYMPSELLRQTIFDKSCYNFQCDTMLNHVELRSAGEVSCCCTTFLDIRIGNVRKHMFSDIWQGAIHRILCLSAQNRTYSFCKKDMCPLFIGKACTGEGAYRPMESAPGTVLLGYDETCNLRCVTCRWELCVANQ